MATCQGSLCSIRFARLEREVINAVFTPACSSPPSVATRPRVAARSPMRGAPWAATKASVCGRERFTEAPRAVRLRRLPPNRNAAKLAAPSKDVRENFPKDYLMRRNQEAFVRSTQVETNAAVVEWKPRGVVRRRTRHRIALSQNKGLAAPDLTLACRFRPSRMRPDRFWDREIREAQIRLERRHAEDALRDSAEGYATQKGEPPS